MGLSDDDPQPFKNRKIDVMKIAEKKFISLPPTTK
jgi:hypothetical protein